MIIICGIISPDMSTSTGTVNIWGTDIQIGQIILFALIVGIYIAALFALPATVEPVILGLPFWAWILIGIILIHYILVYKFIQNYRDLDQEVSVDG